MVTSALSGLALTLAVCAQSSFGTLCVQLLGAPRQRRIRAPSALGSISNWSQARPGRFIAACNERRPSCSERPTHQKLTVSPGTSFSEDLRPRRNLRCKRESRRAENQIPPCPSATRLPSKRTHPTTSFGRSRGPRSWERDQQAYPDISENHSRPTYPQRRYRDVAGGSQAC